MAIFIPRAAERRKVRQEPQGWSIVAAKRSAAAGLRASKYSRICRKSLRACGIRRTGLIGAFSEPWTASSCESEPRWRERVAEPGSRHQPVAGPRRFRDAVHLTSFGFLPALEASAGLLEQPRW